MTAPLADIMEESKARVTTPVLALKIAECVCALPLPRVLELIFIPKLVEPPGTSKLLAGFLNYEGIAVPVLHTRVLFGLPPLTFHLFTPLIVIGAERPELAFVVDAVEDIIFVEEDQLLPLDAHHTFNGCVNGEIKINGKFIPVLDLDLMLRQEEYQRIQEWKVIGQKRLEEFQGVGDDHRHAN